jgi:large subunit ribosomal protein L6
MSRIGKKPIEIPQGVEIKIEGNVVKVKGPKTELSFKVSPEIKVVLAENKISISAEPTTKEVRALWGLTRAILQNMVTGVTTGFQKKLEIEGVGFKANIEGKDLVLDVGFSHTVKIKGPEGITFAVEKNVIVVSGADKGLVGEIAATIRRVKPPEPYKGKGIHYMGEHIRRKLGKKAVATAG